MVVPSTLRAIAFAYFASLCNATPADPTITSPPLLSKREAYDYYDFIGYYESDGVSSSYIGKSMRVLPATTTADANQVVITLSSRNAMVELRMEPTAIVLGRTLTLLRRLQHADTIKYAPDGYGSSFFIKCADSTPRMLYRTNTGALPILQSVTLSGSSSSLSSPSRITVTQTPSFSSTPTSNPTPSHRRKSIAGPIAGGVIGGIAVLSLVAFLIWFVIKKRQICKSAANDPSAYAQSQPVMVQQQPGYPPGPGPITMPEKAAMPPTSPASPYSQQEAWTPAMGGNPGISPSTSPPPTYFHQPQPMYPQQQSQQVSYQ
ncbi:hypothetical protein ACEPPN_012670 [Leptodophora sp. 'Broadleaf-Isolate-01']